MNKNNTPLKLSAQLTMVAFIAILVSFLLFLCVVSFGRYILKNKIEDSNYVEKSIEAKVEEFQKYVTDNNISTGDFEQLEKWVKRENNVMLSIHDRQRVIFDSTVAWRKNHIPEAPPAMDSYRTQYPIQFADKTAFAELFVLIELKFIALINYMSICVAIMAFIFIFTSFIKHKVKYITTLENEVNILEGGNLGYQLTIKGNDELTYLANSIDNMRKSIIERISEEENARLANHKLVTAMSHDLRTPLTILIGLIEIIDGKKYTSDDELSMYITKTKNKAYQIKELSDKIFEYFFAFDIKESELKKEPYEIDVINTMIEDYIFSLKEKGYIFNYTCCNTTDTLMLDIKVFARVFSNIFSNILKYANKDKPVIITSVANNGILTISISNTAIEKKHKEESESTNIGLEVCKNIVKQHSGSFEYIDAAKDNVFTVIINLPLIK